jgi:hypothetical protein
MYFLLRAGKAERTMIYDPARQARASLPRPEDGSVNINPSANMLLNWMPARGISEQRVYFGLDPTNLELLKTLKQENRVQLPELKPGRTYFWRVDGIKSDGSEVQGTFWRFSTGSLICWYQFDETKGDIAKDSSGFGRHARLVNGPTWQEGRFGSALSFDGKDDYVSTALTSSQLGIGSNSPRTVAAWVFVRKFNGGGIFEMGRYSLGQDFSLKTETLDN